MKMGITYRLFFIILCATGLTILCLFLIMWWSLDREFNQYIRMIDQSRLTQVISDLSGKYDEKGNWDFLKENPPHWGASGDISSSPEPKVGPPPSSEPGMNKRRDARPMPQPPDINKPTVSQPNAGPHR